MLDKCNKKVFLIVFSTPALREVALKLKGKGVDVVYWQGYRSYFQEVIIKDKQNFPETVFQHSYSATANIPPEGINNNDFEPVGSDIVEELVKSESQIFTMLGRADYSNSNFAKKRNVYYRYVKYWRGMIKKLKPDAILFPAIPHSAINHTLYVVAKALGVKTIMLDTLTIPHRTSLLTDYKDGPAGLRESLKDYEGKKYFLEDLSPDMQDYYQEKLNPDISKAPDYAKLRKTRRSYMQLPSLSRVIKHLLRLSFFKPTCRYFNMYFGELNLPNFDGKIRGYVVKLRIRKWLKLNKYLRKEHETIQVIPDFSKKFVYIPLHYQPESSTCPMGGTFEDQILMIDIVASSIPDDWVVYVKENPEQWVPANALSYTSRYKGFYEQITRLRNTHMVPIETSTYDLLDNAQTVATITGTAAWEAILRSKPAIVFGYPPFMDCEGVFRVSNFDSCKEAIDRIVGGYKPDKQKVINFLHALEKHSFIANGHRSARFKEDKYVTYKDNVKNIFDAYYQELMKD